jgi:uncharacterized protein GlcG (DUF336 family)
MKLPRREFLLAAGAAALPALSQIAVMLQRLDGSHLAAIGIAEGKARTAVEFRRRPRRSKTRWRAAV